jgi:hypothetical protein
VTTRTWLTTPSGQVPLDDLQRAERWTPGPGLPVEPRVPNRFRGAIVMGIVLTVTSALTFAIAPSLLDGQDPTAGSQDTGGTMDSSG